MKSPTMFTTGRMAFFIAVFALAFMKGASAGTLGVDTGIGINAKVPAVAADTNLGTSVSTNSNDASAGGRLAADTNLGVEANVGAGVNANTHAAKDLHERTNGNVEADSDTDASLKTRIDDDVNARAKLRSSVDTDTTAGSAKSGVGASLKNSVNTGIGIDKK